MSARKDHGLARTFAWPVAMAALTSVALLAGLVGTDAVDIAAVLGLAVPALLCLWKLCWR